MITIWQVAVRSKVGSGGGRGRLHIHTVATILLPPPARLEWDARLGDDDEEVAGLLRTSAALAAAAWGLDESSGCCEVPPPRVRPPCEEEILEGGGAAARAPGAGRGGFAGAGPRVRPSPWKFSSDWEPQQLPILEEDEKGVEFGG